jgi:hypothetical protein
LFAVEVENLRLRNVEFEQLRVELETTRKKLELADQEQIESVVLMLIREVEFAEQCAKLDGQSECARQELALAQAAAAEATILADKARQETAQLVSDSLAGNKAPVVPGSLLAQFAMKGRKAELEKEAKRAKDSLHASTKRLTDALGDFKKSREPCSKSSKGSCSTRLVVAHDYQCYATPSSWRRKLEPSLTTRPPDHVHRPH